MSKTYSAGIVTAYGAAKRAGYQDTYEDFCRQQAQYAQNASAVEQAKQTAVSASQSANQAKQDAQTASTTAQQSAQDAQTAKNNAQTYAQSASQSAGSAQQSAQSAQTVLESIPEDYSDLSEDIDQLKADLGAIPINFYNLYAKFEIVYKGKRWTRGTDLSMSDDADYDIYRVVIDNAKKYYLFKPSGTTYPNYVRFADATNTYLGTSSGLNAINTPPATSYYMYFRVPTNELPVAVSIEDLVKYNTGYRSELDEDVYIEKFTDIDQLNEDITNILSVSENLADPSKFTKNKYMTNAGVVGNSASHYYTNKIPVAEGDIIYVSPPSRYITAFNGDSVVSTTITFPWTVPSGIDGLIITGYTSSIDSLMITKDKRYPFIPYGNYIKKGHLRIENQNALNGNDGITIEMDTVEADTVIEITDYPKIIAAHDRLSGYCKFTTIGEIYFGYGYGSDKYCGIDNTNVNIYINGVLSTSTPHGITISDYLAFSIIMDDNRVGQITINSTGGTATATISLNYAKNGLPFIRSTTALANVKLSAICKDIKNPIWWFGDSYSSLAPERIIGQLKNYGVIGKMLIDAVPGGRTYSNTSTGGYIEFLKLVKLAKPKYVIWALGMNDNNANYNLYLELVKNYCDINGIVLYAVKIPSVPNIDNSGKNAFVDELGIKSIDWASAVDATSAGVWYTGYLSNDNVHPTVLGAKAMAARTLVDCPAIMQF